MLPESEISRHLHVQTRWARHHEWSRGTTWEYPPEPSHILWLVQRGVINVVLDDKRFCVSAGEVWLHPYVPNRRIIVCSDAAWYSLGIDATLYGSIDALAPLSFAQWQPSRREQLEHWLEELVRTERADTWEGKIIYQSLAPAVVAWCWQERGGGLCQLSQSQLSPWLSAVLQEMRDYPQKNISDFIGKSGYSAAQFRRYFNQVLGCPPNEYLLRVRMEKARSLLESTSLSIWHVALEAGFNNQEHFSRSFKKFYGIPPLKFRKLADHLKV